jgi:hypothetical protein
MAARWIVAVLGGIGWSVATLFVVPILIREQETRNPLHYVQISADLIRRTWGEYLIGVIGSPLLLMLPVCALLGLILGLGSVGVWFLTGSIVAVLVFVALQAFLYAAFSALFSVLYKIFHSGLYIYAAEGVPPGAFTAEEFDKAWVVRGKKP